MADEEFTKEKQRNENAVAVFGVVPGGGAGFDGLPVRLCVRRRGICGDGTVMSGMEGDNGDGVSDVGESGSAKTEDMGSVLGGDDTAVLGSGDVSGENDVSGGDALPRREPEVFYREPEPEHYGELVSYDAYSRTYHAGENRYVTVVGNDGTTYIDEEGSLCRVDNTLVENPVSLFSMGGAGASYVNRANAYMVLFPENIAAYEDSAFADCGITTESDDSAGGFGEGIAILCGDYQMLLYPAQGSFTEGTARGMPSATAMCFPMWIISTPYLQTV